MDSIRGNNANDSGVPSVTLCRRRVDAMIHPIKQPRGGQGMVNPVRVSPEGVTPLHAAVQALPPGPVESTFIGPALIGGELQIASGENGRGAAFTVTFGSPGLATTGA
jgi:hypothetical protein